MTPTACVLATNIFSAHTLATHVLAAILLFMFPVWDVVHVRALKQRPTANVRQTFYLSVMVVLATMSCAVVWVTHRTYEHAAVRMPFDLPQPVSIAFALGLCVASLLPLAVVAMSEAAATNYAKAMQPLAHMLPRSGPERWMFAGVALAAGVGEEVLYRGFLPVYFVSLWGVPWKMALVLAVVGFGLAHSSQGVKGIMLTAVLGVMLTAIYFGTGWLWLAMLLHTLIDLRVALLPKRAMPA